MISCLGLGRRGVEHVREQLRAARLLERGRERVHQLVGQLADEADRVRQQVRPAAQLQRARGRVQRVEQAVAHAHLRAGERVQQRRLARVGVADQRDRRQRRALALGALHRARALHVLQAAAQHRDPVARQAAVGLDLGLPRAPRADAAAEALEVAPQAAHARQVVLQLRQLHLQLALGAVRVGGEDVEDHRRAVDHRQAQRLLEVALLARAQLVVARDQVRVARQRRGLRLRHLARAQIGVRMGLLATLDHLPHDRHPGGAQQLAQLRQVVPVGQRRDANARWQRALRPVCPPALRLSR